MSLETKTTNQQGKKTIMGEAAGKEEIWWWGGIG